MLVHRAYKFRIQPKQDQKDFFAKTFGCVRFIYNKMLEDKINYYEKEGKMLYNTPAQYKKEFPWLKEVDSMVLCWSQIHLQTAYNNFFHTKTGFPCFKSKKDGKFSFTTSGHCSLQSNGLHLPKMAPIKIIQHRIIPKGAMLQNVTICKTSTGKYYASLTYEWEAKEPKNKLKRKVGLDFSMPKLFVSSNGEEGNPPKALYKSLNKLAKAQRIFARRRKGGKNREKARLKVAKIYEKVTNQRNDFLHRTSFRITNDYDMVCVEDLDMSVMSRSLQFGKAVADNSWGKFISYVTYKLAAKGGKLIIIDKWFPSTKMCSCCGQVKEKMSLSERVYECDCGLTISRDINAAINILNAGLRRDRLINNRCSNACVPSKPLSF